MITTDAYIGLGSNLANPGQQLRDALRAIDALPHCEILATSSFYASKPMGPQEQPDYVNAVACVRTTLEPLALLDVLQHIEQNQGRVRDGQRWGARTLDLDILLYGDQHIENARLTVPHYGMREREFVLYPLVEIAPALTLPGGEKLKTILHNCPSNGLTRLDTDVEI